MGYALRVQRYRQPVRRSALLNLQPGQQLIVWNTQHGYWLRGTGIENPTCLAKQLIAVRMLNGIAIIRMFTEADQANEAWCDVIAGTITPPAMQTKEYGPRHVPLHTEREDPVLRCARMHMARQQAGRRAHRRR